jgi:ribonucleoside-diphosphate reductase alpha chain
MIVESTPSGIRISRHYTVEGKNPLDEVVWERRTAKIDGLENGVAKVIFEQKDVEVPAFWSQQALNIVANKYLRGALGTPGREDSIRTMISRVVGKIGLEARKGRYFATEADVDVFECELAYMLVHQYVSFNSPVWFNCGVEPEPQCSACFILRVEDDMRSILNWYNEEGIIFQGGSGSGVNLSRVRGSMENIKGGGTASGPVSFMRGADASAGVIKSGGKTRRAAKMVLLDADHPDIYSFIESKVEEERKAHALIAAGWSDGFNVPGGAYDSVFFQNANHSIRVTSDFMGAVANNGSHVLRARTNGASLKTVPARDLWRKMAEAAWACGDPGVQFDTTIQAWHTVPNTDKIYATNPCSEFVFLDNTSCNLASFNLLKYRKEDASFDVDGLRHSTDVMIIAMEVIVGFSSYPTEKIRDMTTKTRPLGLGYANLGALLMMNGLPYDSDEGRAFAASITSLLGGRAYLASAKIATTKGPFAFYPANREEMLGVIIRHRDAAKALPVSSVAIAGAEDWEEALLQGNFHGFRNAQATVLAPTGTIAFMMDCDTTGVEPDIALVKYKKLVGGGSMKIVNESVSQALLNLGYGLNAVEQLIAHIAATGTIEGCALLKPEHLPVFDCAFKPAKGTRSIEPMGHVKMMAAVQPFISGAISKTVNMPEDASIESIQDIYFTAWKLGLKAIAIYRDNCKKSQPLSTKDEKSDSKENNPNAERSVPPRERLPQTRDALNHKFTIAGHEGYLNVGKYPDGRPGEMFITMAKEGSTLAGILDLAATAISIGLQHGIPLETFLNKMIGARYEPAGFTGEREIPMALSITDYIGRFMARRFGPESPAPEEPTEPNPVAKTDVDAPKRSEIVADGPPCPTGCGSLTQRNGACYVCPACGSSTGCG